MIETKRPPRIHEFQNFLDELAKSEPWCSAGDDEVGRWVTGSYDVLERTLMSLARNPHANLQRVEVWRIISGPGIVRERHEELHKFLMSL
jgi:hypothetical protein